MIKKLIGLVTAIAIGISMTACTQTKKSEDKGKLKVMVSINPLREFVEVIGKDKIEVKTMVPDGVEPHDFEPKAKELEELNSSKIFVYNGLGMEEWLDKVLGTIQDKDKITIVDSSNGTSVIQTNGKKDPHIFLSLKEAKVQAKNIKDALVKVDDKNREFYEKNYKNFEAELDELYKSNEERFKALTSRDFVTGHEAFGYLCRDLNLKQKAVTDLFGEGELTPQNLRELVEYCKENKIKTIFMEELASPKVSETLANEVGAKIEKINTLESKEEEKDYIQTMKENLDMIYNSLK